MTNLRTHRPGVRERHFGVVPLSRRGSTPMLQAMPGWVIDGEDWIKRRVAFLKERLAEDLTDDERHAAEAEIEVLSKEGGIMPGGRRFPRIWRRLGRKG